MSKRHETLEGAFLFDGFEIDCKSIYPLSMSRRIFLSKIGNRVVTEDHCQDESEVAGVLYACTLKPNQLGKYLKNPDKFQEEALEFVFNLDDEFALERFIGEIKNEAERLALAAVESTEGKQ